MQLPEDGVCGKRVNEALATNAVEKIFDRRPNLGS